MTNFASAVALASVLSLAAFAELGCATGGGVAQDAAEAVPRFRLAAAQGEAPAQYQLGLAYATGLGVAQDYVQAHMWFNLVASRTRRNDLRDDSVENRDRVAQQLTADQLAEALRLAREWDAVHPREPEVEAVRRESSPTSPCAVS